MSSPQILRYMDKFHVGKGNKRPETLAITASLGRILIHQKVDTSYTRRKRSLEGTLDEQS